MVSNKYACPIAMAVFFAVLFSHAGEHISCKKLVPYYKFEILCTY